MNPQEARAKVEHMLQRNIDANPHLKNAYLFVHSERQSLHWKMACGKFRETAVNEDQPYHTASIGKAFTATLIALLVQEGKLSFDDPTSRYLPQEIMQGLHVYKGRDYSNEILVRHLISNTSGLPDYFEDKPREGKPYFDLLLEEPSRFWTPQETQDWTKQHLKPKFPPGRGVHYANTGFDLLGLIIEQVTSRPYHEALQELLFRPLDMNHSYLLQFSEPDKPSAYPVAQLTVKHNKVIDPVQYRSFSGIFASGQTVSTSEDLFRFISALVQHRLVSKELLAQMMDWKRLRMGVGYGYGLMKVRMHPFTGRYDVWGHLGSLGSFMLYNPGMDAYVIGSFNKTGYFGQSVRFVAQVLRILAKVEP